jgi:1,4-dihydroxy-2-naphthoate polyprenyltransferase
LANFKSWIKAFRLRTLPLAFAALTMGAFLAAYAGNFNLVIYLLSLFTAFLLQILSNLANDYGDAQSGLDAAVHRVGPKRTVHTGEISKAQMKRAIFLTIFIALVSGISLLLVAFPDDRKKALLFLIIGLASIVAAIRYTIGKNPYGYAGWGDLFVLIFFGWVAVAGSLFLYTRQFDWLVMLPATTIGLFAVAVLNINNVRDLEADRKSGKYSLAVRMGRVNAVRYHIFLLTMGLICSLAFGVMNWFSGWDWLFLVAVPLLIRNALAVARYHEPAQLDPYLKQMAIATLLFVLLFGLGILVG